MSSDDSARAGEIHVFELGIVRFSEIGHVQWLHNEPYIHQKISVSTNICFYGEYYKWSTYDKLDSCCFWILSDLYYLKHIKHDFQAKLTLLWPLSGDTMATFL